MAARARRRRWISCRAAWLAAASLVVVARAQPSAAVAILDQVARSEALEADLRRLCDVIGPRPAGSPAMREAVEWAVETFRAAGVDRVDIETFEAPASWTQGETRIAVQSPARFELKAAATAWAPATPESGVTAEVIDAGGGGQGRVRRLGARARGKILLVVLGEARTFHQLGIEQRNAIYSIREAAEVGAAAVIFASTRPNRVLFRHIHVVDGGFDPLPSAVVAREDALRLRRLIERGPVQAFVSLPNRVGGPREGWNVVAEIRGAEKPDEQVILGAHLDSWDLGTGCVDNAVNVALTIEAARAIVASGFRPARTIRFILFGAEERGLIGSRAYVRRHRDELDRVAAVMVHDMGQGPLEGYFLGGRLDVEARLRQAMEPIEGRRRFNHAFEAFFGSDHFDFLIEGVPTLLGRQDTSDYILPYHSELDTFDKVRPSIVRENAEIAAVTIYRLADAPERLGERWSRAQIEDLLRTTRLDEQLKFLELWEQWESGERGRAKGSAP